jgi:heat shock protein HslJ
MRAPVIVVIAALLAVAGLMPAGSAAAQDAPPGNGFPAIPPIVWQLIAFPGYDGGIEPGRYTVQFVPDGTINIRADCNWVLGLWNGANGVIDITATMTTTVGCPAGSLEQPFVQALDEATGYVLDGISLVISGPSGAMHFSPTLPDMA